MATTKTCPKCGCENTEPDALFCEDCGASLKEEICPNCGLPVEPGVDVCENCFAHLLTDKCSFCGKSVEPDDVYCGECGEPLKGVPCPTCGTMNHYNFCMKCGTALTEMAEKEVKIASAEPKVKEMNKLAAEVHQLEKNMPKAMTLKNESITVKPIKKTLKPQNDRADERIRRQFEELMQQKPPLMTTEGAPKNMKNEVDTVAEKKKELQKVLDDMEAKPKETPVLTRNHCMARKPKSVSVGWRCNHMNALHASPQECAHPQKGGKWVVLNNMTEDDLVDDRK